LRGVFPQAPKDYLVGMDARHDPHSFALGVKCWVSQEAANKLCRLSASHIQPD